MIKVTFDPNGQVITLNDIQIGECFVFLNDTQKILYQKINMNGTHGFLNVCTGSATIITISMEQKKVIRYDAELKASPTKG